MGLDVTIAAAELHPRTVSIVAGALWEWPPAVCGHYRDESTLGRARAWCLASYRAFERLAAEPASGVHLRPATFYFRRPISELPREARKLEDLSRHISGVVHDPALIQANGVNTRAGMCDAYTYLAPMIDTDVYLEHLLTQARSTGIAIVQHRVNGPLPSQEASLRRSFKADLIINCTGLGARELAPDEVTPLRGALVRARNDGRAIPRVTGAHCVPFDEEAGGPGFVFILPRGSGTLLLGGLAEPGQWETEIGLDNYPPVREMLERCLAFLPSLKGLEVDAAEPVRVGLRPFRGQGARVEQEPGARIIHNYGHGGSGVTLSWGCAEEVAQLAQRILSWEEPKARPATQEAEVSPFATPTGL
jgi:D-amino-acid oxidase